MSRSRHWEKVSSRRKRSPDQRFNRRASSSSDMCADGADFDAQGGAAASCISSGAGACIRGMASACGKFHSASSRRRVRDSAV